MVNGPSSGRQDDMLKAICGKYPNDTKTEEARSKQEIHQMKRRISSLEKAFDSILTGDDSRAIEEAHKDLMDGQTIGLSQIKKKHS